jgi:hypothetical protein
MSSFWNIYIFQDGYTDILLDAIATKQRYHDALYALSGSA